MNHTKKLEFFKNKLNETISEIEHIIYSEAITMLNDDVNSDKVQNWVTNTLNQFNSKPKPETQAEKNKKIDAAKRKQEKAAKFELVNNKMKALLNEYGVVAIGIFDYKDVTDFEYQTIVELTKNLGYYFTDNGDGLAIPYVSEKPIDENFTKSFTDIENEFDAFPFGNILDTYKVFNLFDFKNKLMVNTVS